MFPDAPSFSCVLAVNAARELDKDGTTPLHLASAIRSDVDPGAEVVKLLLEHKANPCAVDKRGYTVRARLVR